MSTYKPSDDGVTHINIHSEGKTELGRRLDNLSKEPFKHPDYGSFNSVEGLYWYLVTNREVEEFRHLFGHAVRKASIAYMDEPRHTNGRLVEEATRASQYKVLSNDSLKTLLIESTLPLTCYCYWGSSNNPKTRPAKAHQNHAAHFEILRRYLKAVEDSDRQFFHDILNPSEQ